MSVIGVDLGGTKLAGALFSDEGEILRRESAVISSREGDGVGALIADQVQSLLAESHQLRQPTVAVGVSVPGIYRAATGTVWAPNISGWKDYPLRNFLESVVDEDVRVNVDSDRACSILGEGWQGEARGRRHAIFLAVGTGIGAGILVDGRVLRGRHDIAGAIGWLALDRPYRSDYDACGCFEYQASGEGIARVARDLIAMNPTVDTRLRHFHPATLTAHHVFDALDDGDSLAAEVLDVAVQFWGMAVANLVSLFDPEIIVFGGGVFGPASRFLHRIQTEAAQWAQPISMPAVKLAVSSLGGDAPLFGAARLALQEGVRK